MNDNPLIYDDGDLYERFIKEYFNLNPMGNPLQAWSYLKMHSQYDASDSEGNPITLDAVINSYKDYLLYWQKTFGQKDEKYLSKDDRKVDPELFIANKLYQSVWKASATPRDEYLFGSHDEEYYAKRTKEFDDGCPKKKG